VSALDAVSATQRPSPLEIASGCVFGLAPPLSLPEGGEATTPAQALEQAILPALKRPPCLVSFSGDSWSAVLLAAAVQLARREGLELPVPATARIAAGRRDEPAQERVIVHLGLTQWVRFEFEDELDLVGPVAMKVLRNHGLMAPCDVHLRMPHIVEACGGSLIMGTGAAEAFGARDVPVLVPWLRPRARLEVWARKAAELTTEPRGEAERMAWVSRLRSVRTAMDSLESVARPFRVGVFHPFFDTRFLAALRPDDSLRKLFGELLPGSVLGERRRRTGEQACWNRHSLALVDAWDGEGVDPELVDLGALLSEWSKQRPDRRSFLMLQSVALAREARSMARQLAEAVGGFA
jgi:hypothetical protein